MDDPGRQQRIEGQLAAGDEDPLEQIARFAQGGQHPWRSDTPGSFCPVSFQHEPATGALVDVAYLVVIARYRKMALRAFRLRMGGPNGMVPFVGLRRPFSPQAERLSEEPHMKKSKATADQPVGIVIATGGIVPTSPRVKAYFWCEEPTPGADESEK